MAQFTNKDGSMYEGDINIDRNPHGQGTITYPNGRKYVGGWKNDKRNGQGTETFPDGHKYVGEWKNGEKNGQGTQTHPDVDKYEGEWKDGTIL